MQSLFDDECGLIKNFLQKVYINKTIGFEVFTT